MLFNAALVALLASFQIAAAVPVTEDDATVQVNKALRLIKTSEEDPGQWVTDEQKDELVVQKINFIDITDIQVRPTNELVECRADSRRMKASCPSCLPPTTSPPSPSARSGIQLP
jgi:hypothetical protein